MSGHRWRSGCVFRLVSRLIDRVKLKDFDRQFGALLGLAKGSLLCMLITFFSVTLLGEQKRAAIVQSHRAMRWRCC